MKGVLIHIVHVLIHMVHVLTHERCLIHERCFNPHRSWNLHRKLSKIHMKNVFIHMEIFLKSSGKLFFIHIA